MAGLLSWPLVWRPGARPDPAAPAALVTLAPRLRHPGLPPEVAVLLPNQDGCRALLAALAASPPPPGSAAGLFLADPFLRIAPVAAALRAAGIATVANLPSAGQHDPELAQPLADVRLDSAREAERLAAFKAAGLRTLAVACDGEAANALAATGPDLVLVLPKVGDFAAGFPSLRQRGAAAQSVHEALAAAGWRGSLLLLADRTEAEHPRLWPACVGGAVCRPAPLQA